MTRYIVWAIGESFLIIIRVFPLLNDLYRYYWHFNGMEGLMEDTGEENEPKQHVSRRLGHRWVFFYIIRLFSNA